MGRELVRQRRIYNVQIEFLVILRILKYLEPCLERETFDVFLLIEYIIFVSHEKGDDILTLEIGHDVEMSQ